MDQVVSTSYAEPSVSGGAHPSYYQRRTGGEADAFRRSSRYVPQTERIERSVRGCQVKGPRVLLSCKQSHSQGFKTRLRADDRHLLGFTPV